MTVSVSVRLAPSVADSAQTGRLLLLLSARGDEEPRNLVTDHDNTAQVFGIKQNQKVKNEELPEHLRDHAWFIAFAPVEAPRIALVVLVEHGGSGSGAAAPIARKLLDSYLMREADARQLTGG